jgi:hypothetical protein
MKSVRVAFPIGVALLSALLLCIGAFVYHYEFSVFIFPLCLGSFVIVMGLFSALAEGRVSDDQPAREAGPGEDEEGLLWEGNTWIQIASFIGLLALCWGLGFVAGVVIFVFTYLWRAGWKPWFAAVFGVASGFVIWFLFSYLFATPLPFWPVFMR